MGPDHEHHHWRLTWLGGDTLLARRVARPVARFMRIEASGGVLLLAGAALALVWFNLSHDGYEAFWGTPLGFEVGSFHFELTLHEWVNEGLMALFFFVVGLEIKREMVAGELRDPRAAALPIVAALGGMAVPALIYAALNAGGYGARGWGIPMATDIAFAVGIVSLLGTRVPVALKLFLLTLAVADDLGGIVVIAVFYARGIEPTWLAAAAALYLGMALLRRAHVWYAPVYLVLGVAGWYLVLRSGVHASIAGVVAGFLIPTRPLRDHLGAEAIADRLENQPELTAEDVKQAAFLIKEAVPLNQRLTDLLHPWTSFVIVPVFAIANAAIPLDRASLAAAVQSPITWGAFLGLLVGKTLGVSSAAFLAVRTGLARLPKGVGWMQVIGVAIAAGIGFTVAMFVTGISFPDIERQTRATVGVFGASLVAAVLSAAVLVLASRRMTAAERAADEAEEEELFAESPRPQVVTG